MPDEVLSFEDHQRRLDDNASVVRCARCGKWILATSTRCPECGVHFQGAAVEFTHASEAETSRRSMPMWVVVMTAALLAAVLLAVLGMP